MSDKGVENPISHPEDRIAQSISRGLSREIPRRDFGNAALKVAFAAAIAAIGAKTGLFRRTGETILHKVKAKETEDYWGQPIEGSAPETLITVPVEGGYDGVPVRLRPTQAEKDLIGLAKFGSKIDNAQQVFGGVYSGYPEERGRFEKDGKFFGTWYKVENIPVKDKEGNEKAVDGYIAANYLREPTKAELQAR